MQNTNNQKRQLKIKLARALPEDIAAALSSVDNAKKIEAIGKKYSLELKKITEVSTQIGEYVLGVTPYGALAQNIKDKTGIPLDLGQKMVNEILQDVFGPIKINLQKHLANLKNTQPLNAPTPKAQDDLLELQAPAPNPDFLFPRPAAGTPLPPDAEPAYREPVIEQPLAIDIQAPAKPAFDIIRTLKSDVERSEVDKKNELNRKQITSIPKQTTVRELPQINPSTGNYAKDPYREQI